MNESFDKTPYNLVLLEDVLYNCMFLNKTVFTVPSMNEETVSSFYSMIQADDSLFSYKYAVYCKLREEGWYCISVMLDS